MPAQPQLVAWLMCDMVYIDPATGKHSFLGCFSSIRVRRFPAKHPRMFWYLSLSDVPVGEHTLKITLNVDLDQPQPLLERKFQSQSPLHRINLINEIHNLTFPKAAGYNIVIEVDGDPILATPLNVTGVEPPQAPPGAETPPDPA